MKTVYIEYCTRLDMPIVIWLVHVASSYRLFVPRVFWLALPLRTASCSYFRQFSEMKYVQTFGFALLECVVRADPPAGSQ